ncbi:MAG: DUF4062 domain-containing protein [bacterium]
MKRHKIFVSSVQKEFEKERRAIKDFITSDSLCRRFFEVFLFEDAAVQDRLPNELYLEKVNNCNIYVCLLGNEYGSLDIEGVSPTEREFNLATKMAKTRFFFVKDTDDTKRHPKTLKLIHKASGELIRRRFLDIPELIAQIYTGLVQYLEDIGTLQLIPFDASVCQEAEFEDIAEDTVSWFLETAQVERKFALGKSTPFIQALTHLDLLNDNKLTMQPYFFLVKNRKGFTH